MIYRSLNKNQADMWALMTHGPKMTLNPFTETLIPLGHCKYSFFKTHIKAIKSMGQSEYETFCNIWDNLPNLISDVEYLTLMTHLENKIAA